MFKALVDEHWPSGKNLLIFCDVNLEEIILGTSGRISHVLMLFFS
jgi:hypothetical protein